MILIIFPPVGVDHLEGAHSLTKTIVVRPGEKMEIRLLSQPKIITKMEKKDLKTMFKANRLGSWKLMRPVFNGIRVDIYWWKPTLENAKYIPNTLVIYFQK